VATIARTVLVGGRVQGVGFRYATLAQAGRLDLGGWVRNLADGRVQVFVEGDPERVEALIAWLRAGPPGARVAEVAVEESEPAGLCGFEIQRTARGAG
jgi:acylphosphatase